MTTTAQALIEAAYSRSTANDAGKLASDAELLGRLNRVFQGLYALAARQRPDEFLAALVLTIGGSPAFAILPSDQIEIRRIQNASGAKVHLIPTREVDRSWHIAPSVYRVGLALTSRGRVGDPIPGDVLTLWVLDAPATLVTLATLIDLRFPTRHHEILANDLALYLATKDEGRDPAHYTQVANDQRQKLVAFATEYDLDASALEFVHGPATRVPSASGG